MASVPDTKDEIKTAIQEIQAEIKDVLGKCGLSMRQFASRLYFEGVDIEDDEEEKRFCEKFKKDLSRASSKKEKLLELQGYRSFLYTVTEVKATNLIFTPNEPIKRFGSEFDKKMAEISKELEEKIRQKPIDPLGEPDLEYR